MVFQSNRLDIRPSRHLILLVLVVHLLALMAVLLIAVDLWLACALVLLVVTHGTYIVLYQVLMRSPRAVIRLQIVPGEVKAFLSSGAEVDVEVAADSVVYSRFVLLRLVPVDGGSALNVPLFTDSCDSVALRHLRVLLKCQSAGDHKAAGANDPTGS